MMHSNINRRRFLQYGSAAMVSATWPRGRVGSGLPEGGDRAAEGMAYTGSPELKALLQIGLDAARQGGAAYADVVYQHTRSEEWSFSSPDETLLAAVGLRALYNGYWGFSGLDGLANADAMARLGKDAIAQAKNGARGTPRRVDLAPAPVVRDGRWATPIEMDPFLVPREERQDYLRAMLAHVKRARVSVMMTYTRFLFLKDERTFASTEGTFITQTIYTTGGHLTVTTEPHFKSENSGSRSAEFMTYAGGGWEQILRIPFRDRADQLIEDAERIRVGKSVDLGRHDVVVDAATMAEIMNRTVRPATELPRAMGYSANEEGTSFLNDPLEMLGTFRVASPLVNIAADRSLPEGAATVKWDDEGVEPRSTPLITQGVLSDFQTSRESASWLAPYYARRGTPVRSSGGAGREKASWPTKQEPSNLVMTPGKESVTFEDLVADTKRGYAIWNAHLTVDPQCLNGDGYPGMMREIRNGKLGDVVHGARILFRTPELLKNITAIGGSSSVRHCGVPRILWKHELNHAHTIVAVPALITGMSLNDSRRRG